MKYVDMTAEHKVEVPYLPERSKSGAVNPTLDMHWADGWRELTATDEPTPGWQVDEWGYIDVDGMTCRKVIVSQSDPAANKAAQDAQKAAEDAVLRAAKIAAITQDMWDQAGALRFTLEKYCGAGAVTNHAITEASVMKLLLQRRMSGTLTTAELAELAVDTMVLKELFTVIAGWTGDGTIWTWPWELMP